jgi:hypothetical protein
MKRRQRRQPFKLYRVQSPCYAFWFCSLDIVLAIGGSIRCANFLQGKFGRARFC